MHRHGYKGRKLHRNEAQRRALLRGFAISLIEHGRIETTLPRAKEIVPFVEPLITKAKKGGLTARRAIISALDNLAATNTLVDQLAPQLGGRNSGHLRITRTRLRVGDNAQLATVEFVDELKAPATTEPVTTPAAPKATTKPSVTAKKPVVASKAAAAPKKMTAQDKHLDHKPATTVRKSGTR